MCVPQVLVPAEARRAHWLLWSLSYRRLWASWQLTVVLRQGLFCFCHFAVHFRLACMQVFGWCCLCLPYHNRSWDDIWVSGIKLGSSGCCGKYFYPPNYLSNPQLHVVALVYLDVHACSIHSRGPITGLLESLGQRVDLSLLVPEKCLSSWGSSFSRPTCRSSISRKCLCLPCFLCSTLHSTAYTMSQETLLLPLWALAGKEARPTPPSVDRLAM